ncbi:hypothetical protein [Flagellatimonas centrodinii]|uniref:hypothetical protein n=1 Tax=Flagellatimonas centrodinii TaxID=2806210 RepID=UPI003F507AAD
MVIGEIRTGPKVTALSDGTLELRVRISADTRAPRSKQWVTLLLTDEWAETWEQHLLIGVTVAVKGSLKWRSFVHKNVRYDVAEVHVEHLSLSGHQDAGSQQAVKGDSLDTAEKSDPVAEDQPAHARGETRGSITDTSTLPFGPASMGAPVSLRHEIDQAGWDQAPSTGRQTLTGASDVRPPENNALASTANDEQLHEQPAVGARDAGEIESGAPEVGPSAGVPTVGTDSNPSTCPTTKPGPVGPSTRKAIPSLSRIELEGGTDY